MILAEIGFVSRKSFNMRRIKSKRKLHQKMALYLYINVDDRQKLDVNNLFMHR